MLILWNLYVGDDTWYLGVMFAECEGDGIGSDFIQDALWGVISG